MNNDTKINSFRYFHAFIPYLFLHLYIVHKVYKMDLKTLLRNVELDVRELKCLADSYLSQPADEELVELFSRAISQAQERLAQMAQLVSDTPIVSTTSELIEPSAPVSVEPTVTENDVVGAAMVDAEEGGDEADEETFEPKELAEENDEEIAGDEMDEDDVDDGEKETVIPIVGERILVANNLIESFTLNDTFRFARDLFEGNTDQMKKILNQVSQMTSYDTAVAFLSAKIKITEEDETCVDFLDLLKRYFN